jgi:hypothetical protein
MKDKSRHWATYMMTFDWENNNFSLAPNDYKNAHLLKLDNGCFALQPNNRIFWRDSNFITKPLDPKSIPKYKVDKEIFICERSDRWTSENTDSFYYDSIEENEEDYWVERLGREAAVDLFISQKVSKEVMNRAVLLPEEQYRKWVEICGTIGHTLNTVSQEVEQAQGYAILPEGQPR